MKINLITPEQHAELLQIQKEFPVLTFQNSGYQYIDKSKLTDQDKEKIKEIETILKASIYGFSSFTNFRHDNNGNLQIRFNYNYDYDTKGYFIGVGYILVDELLNGFKN